LYAACPSARHCGVGSHPRPPHRIDADQPAVEIDVAQRFEQQNGLNSSAASLPQIGQGFRRTCERDGHGANLGIAGLRREPWDVRPAEAGCGKPPSRALSLFSCICERVRELEAGTDTGIVIAVTERACAGRSAAPYRETRMNALLAMRCRPGIVPVCGGPGSAVHHYALTRFVLHRFPDTQSGQGHDEGKWPNEPNRGKCRDFNAESRRGPAAQGPGMTDAVTVRSGRQVAGRRGPSRPPRRALSLTRRTVPNSANRSGATVAGFWENEADREPNDFTPCRRNAGRLAPG